LVGKGVCFDSGGYNLKPSGAIEDMKLDMAGGATVLAILRYAIKTGLKKNIVVGIPMVENLVSHNAYKPGEVITMYNGKTVEIGNTDAE
jgi:leucyl aminopeptidase